MSSTPSPTTQSAHAKALGIDRTTLWRWVTKNRCPPERAAEAERVLGIPKHELRPDVFPKPEEKA